MSARQIVALLFLSILISTAVSAESYYADVEITIDDIGLAVFEGTTNNPRLSNHETDFFTSKKGSYWLFNLSLPEQEIFSDYLVSIRLPEDSSINYVKAKEGFRIETIDDAIIVKVNGKNGPIEAAIQYQLGKSSTQSYWFYMIVFPVFLFFAGFMIYFSILKFRQHPRSSSEKKAMSQQDVYDSHLLTDRQKDIMKMVVSSQKSLSQTAVCEALKLPKSSVSRNIDSLVHKGLLKKEKRGMSTILSLSDLETYEKEHEKRG